MRFTIYLDGRVEIHSFYPSTVGTNECGIEDSGALLCAGNFAVPHTIYRSVQTAWQTERLVTHPDAEMSVFDDRNLIVTGP